MSAAPPESHGVLIPGTELEVTAYASGAGNDLCIVINRKGHLCLGRIILENLCQLDRSNIRIAIGDMVLAPMANSECSS
ncbi:MAG: hypothetical protein ABL907_22790 [Hyphomicrobium sp.]